MSRLGVIAASALAFCALVQPAGAAGEQDADREGLALVLAQVPLDYAAAVRTHDSAAAARVRGLVRVARAGTARLGREGTASGRVRAARAGQALERLEVLLGATRVRLQPWPFVARVKTLVARAAQAEGGGPEAPPPAGYEYGQIEADLDRAQQALEDDPAAAELQLAAAAIRYRNGPATRLQSRDPAPAARTFAALDAARRLVARGAGPEAVDREISNVRDNLRLSAQTLGEVAVSNSTVIGDAAVIVFREGLEAVLILAALTASFTGARRRLRRPVLLGALAGLVVTALTWVAAQTVISSLSTGALELQAITGLLAIGVLLLITNWFFHRIYWSAWIGRFHQRRKSLEEVDRRSFLSGQLLGLALLGLTSVYREGFETVLFLQSLQLSAGTETTMIGVGIGLAATLAVGGVTFLLRWKLPYKRMLIVTGLLITLVLAVMTGTTAHTMQGLGWISTSPTPFDTPFWTTTWLGLFPTWETIAAQLAAVVFVLGSYLVAREVQAGRRRRRSDPEPRPDPRAPVAVGASPPAQPR